MTNCCRHSSNACSVDFRARRQNDDGWSTSIRYRLSTWPSSRLGSKRCSVAIVNSSKSGMHCWRSTTNSPSTTGYRAKSNPSQGAFAKGSTPSTSNNVRNSCVSWSSKFASPDQTCRFTCAFLRMSRPPRRTPVPTRARPSQADEPRLINRVCVHLVETELSVLTRQCLDRRIPDRDTLVDEVSAWGHDRNVNQSDIDWQFTTDDARIKLKRLYPATLP